MDQSIFLLVLLFFFSLAFQVPSTLGDIKTITVSSDSRPIIMLKDFCFDATGHVSLKVSNVSITTTSTSTTPTNASRLGIYISDLDAIPYSALVILGDQGKTCLHLESPSPHKHYRPITTFAQLLSPQSSITKTLPIPDFNKTRSSVHSIYHLGIYFLNCEAPNTSVSMHLHLEVYNIDRNGKDYLEVGETKLPMIYFVFSGLYAPLVAFWFFQCYNNRRFVRRIHVLMSVLIVAQLLNLFFEAEDKHYVKVTGTPHGWDLWFYVFNCVRALLFITVCLLLGMGWSILKPTLAPKDKIILAGGVTMQVFASVTYVYISVVGLSKTVVVYLIPLLFLVHLGGFLIVLIPINSSLKAIKEALKADDGTASRDLTRMTKLNYFYGCVACFWLMRTFAFYVYANYAERTDDFCNLWKLVWLMELLTLGLYIGMYTVFRPTPQDEYSNMNIQDEEIALAEIRSRFSMF